MRRLFYLLAMPFMLAIPFLTAGKAEAQVTLEIEGHATFALEELSRLADGQGVGGLVTVVYPVRPSSMFNIIGKVGFNQYGTKSGEVYRGESVMLVDSVYRGIPITAGARLYYDQDRRFYTEVHLGLENKLGDLDHFDGKDETFTIHPALTVGAGFSVSPRLALVASLGLSTDLWRYANLGVSYRFRE
jgi:hypothetical protein